MKTLLNSGKKIVFIDFTESTWLEKYHFHEIVSALSIDSVGQGFWV